MFIPLCVAVMRKEINPLIDFTIGVLFAIAVGAFLILAFPAKRPVSWIHSFFTVSFGWMLFSLIGAVPLFLSGHFASFIDAWFEAMSGFATTGLTLANDLDHMSYAHNMWRHLTMFIGGQGIILASLSIITKAKAAVIGFYIGEGRDERILPNVIATSRFIWKVSFFYMLLGITVYTGILLYKGLYIERAVYHAIWLFFASFDTGGFAPQSQNIAYYHSFLLESATAVFMILGAMNFNLHFWIWTKKKTELFKNFEIKTFLFTFFILLCLIYIPLKNMAISEMFRKGFYQLISAHTGCGFANIDSFEIMGFPALSLISLIFAMMIGGAVCSTTGAIKLMRVGIIFKTFLMEIKRWMMPASAVYNDTFHHLQDISLSNDKIKSAYLYTGMFVTVYILGAIIGMFYGYDPLMALFESVSATANVGLSVGITQPSMPVGMKILYIFQMWAGRLEFLSIFVSIGLILSWAKK
ncbi:MAG: potassium transporter TrkG [Candidatus Omnitrophica bacterium]|nr:potassium transporter TrkG [Candidatus Omnitrophota bacterium]MDD5081294.1 potassium transporter TrkG [Candidatus Omnitrophota bacterium]